MSRNIEIKAHIANREVLLERAAALATQGPIEILQDDTFFRSQSGRLKLRIFPDGTGELIYYRRADEAGPRTSFYLISPTSAPDVLRQSLSLACGQLGHVKKRRILFIAGKTRIHVDQVDGLGDFLELERVLDDDESEAAAMPDIEHLMKALDVEPRQLVHQAYVDLLAAI